MSTIEAAARPLSHRPSDASVAYVLDDGESAVEPVRLPYFLIQVFGLVPGDGLL